LIRYVPAKRQLVFNGLHGVTFQDIKLFITIAVQVKKTIGGLAQMDKTSTTNQQ
jgi:hypothetical protein